MGKDPTRAPSSQLHLPPGFRFYPTDEELVVHYLCKKAASEPFAVPIIAEVELYKFDPWDLPAKALFGEKEWYFFSPRDRKYPNGSRPNRAAGSGYWKATGTDKPINTLGGSQKVGVKKALVFYKGKAPKGVKTNWIMHEYRLADSAARSTKRKGSLRLDDWVLCRIYKKSSSAQKIAKERSESSCLDEVLASLPEIDDSGLTSIPRLNASRGLLPEHDLKSSTGFYQPQAQYSAHSDLTTVFRSEEMPRKKANHAADIDMGGDPNCRGRISYRGCDDSSQEAGGSSPELTHMSNETSRQHSPPDSVEDESVESTFSSLPSFPTSQLAGTFHQPFFFDSLSSPYGRLETFSALGDGEYFNFSSDYTFQRTVS